MKPYKVRKTLPITLELLVEVEGEVGPPEPDVGIMSTYVEDLTVVKVGIDGKPESSWIRLCGHATALDEWLVESLIEQNKDTIEEKLLED